MTKTKTKKKAKKNDEDMLFYVGVIGTKPAYSVCKPGSWSYTTTSKTVLAGIVKELDERIKHANRWEGPKQTIQRWINIRGGFSCSLTPGEAADLREKLVDGITKI